MAENLWKRVFETGFEKHCREAIALGADVNCPDATPYGPPLIAAAYFRLQAIAKVLLEHGARPDYRGNWERTALCEAAMRGSVSFCEMLLDAGADPNAIAKFGSSALAAAASNGKVEACKLLVKRGAAIDTCHPINNTALCSALNNFEFAAAIALVKLGANPNFMPERAHQHYRTPFMLAASSGDVGLIKAMLDSGKVDPFARPEGAPTAAQLAEKYPQALELILVYQTEYLLSNSGTNAALDVAAELDGAGVKRSTGLAL